MGARVQNRRQDEPGLQATGPSAALRAIAGFEVLKGFVALAAGLGFLSLLHQDLHHIAASMIGHVGLDPGAHCPAIILMDIDQLLSANRRTLLLTVAAYVTVRFLEAHRLGHERRWVEWLGAFSGALYVPFELRHLIHSPSLATAAVVVVNIAVVGYLGWELWQLGVPSAVRSADP
jgi:uncharacterized membrane protein (DUF2068 family)